MYILSLFLEVINLIMFLKCEYPEDNQHIAQKTKKKQKKVFFFLNHKPEIIRMKGNDYIYMKSKIHVFSKRRYEEWKHILL